MQTRKIRPKSENNTEMELYREQGQPMPVNRTNHTASALAMSEAYCEFKHFYSLNRSASIDEPDSRFHPLRGDSAQDRDPHRGISYRKW